MAFHQPLDPEPPVSQLMIEWDTGGSPLPDIPPGHKSDDVVGHPAGYGSLAGNAWGKAWAESSLIA
jgi:hypothetical protein